jgi:hypothetical protein
MGAHGGTCVKLLSRTWRTTACSSVPALIRRGSLLHPASEDAGFSGCSSRHRCTASIWHRRYALPPVAHRAVMPIASAARVPAPTCAHVAPEAARGSGGHRSSSLAGAVTGARIYGDVDGITTMPRPHATPPPNDAAESQGAHAGTPNQARRTGRPAHADTSPSGIGGTSCRRRSRPRRSNVRRADAFAAAARPDVGRERASRRSSAIVCGSRSPLLGSDGGVICSVAFFAPTQPAVCEREAPLLATLPFGDNRLPSRVFG